MKLKVIFIFSFFQCCCLIIYGQSHTKSFVKKNILESKDSNSLFRIKLFYQSQLQTWCDGMIALQVQGGEDDGGIFCAAHKFVHGRCGDAVYPFIKMFGLSGNEKYRTAARKVYSWSEAHVSQTDGSWTNETGGKNDWKGISCFSVIALGEALNHHGDVLLPNEKKQWKERLLKGGDYILSNFTFETGDINYPMSASAALAVCWKASGETKYLQRAREMADFGLQYFTANKLIWGEGVRGKNDTTAKGLRPIDIPYNLEESLPNLALYAKLTGDQKVLKIVSESLLAHLKFMLPDGGLDAGWCSRQYKWTYFGSSTADGCAGGFALMGYDTQQFGEAAFRNLQLRKSYTREGLLYGGAHLYSRKIPGCSHHTFASAKGLATALDAGILEGKPTMLPNDKPYGVRSWPEAGIIQVAIGPWRASITTNDIASSPKRGGHPMGGALTMLWHEQAGPIAVASMNDYVTYEGANMQKSVATEQFCLTPRIEVESGGIRYNNLYDGKATLSWVKKGDSIRATINGDLRDVRGNELPSGAFGIVYVFTNNMFSMSVHSTAAGAKLILPVVSPASEKVNYAGKGAWVITKKLCSINVTGRQTPEWKKVSPDRVFNFVPGFEAVAVENVLDDSGNAHISIKIVN